MVFEESHLVVERLNAGSASEATILQSAIATGVAAFGKDGGRAAHAAFAKMVKRLLDGA